MIRAIMIETLRRIFSSIQKHNPTKEERCRFYIAQEFQPIKCIPYKVYDIQNVFVLFLLHEQACVSKIKKIQN